ncbi:MAG: prolyl oligopeptidase family serine peptidase [Mangrovibacterium sp.]
MKRFICFITLILMWTFCIHAQQKVSRISDVIYDHKDGLAFVFDVVIPEKQNGAAILNIISGGWVSRAASAMSSESYKQYTNKGYTIFVITHCSQPRYNIPEIIAQVQRAIRFIRFNAGKYGIDPDKLGLTGHSAGGHLAISAAVFGEDAIPEQKYREIHSIQANQKVDPIELVSGKVRVVACFYPPTNFVNYINRDTNWFDFPMVRNVSANGSFVATPDSTREFQNEALRTISPYFFISERTPPICIIHGTADELVPFSQSVSFIAKLMEYDIPYLFVPREAKGHGWQTDSTDHDALGKWFDKYLLDK